MTRQHIILAIALIVLCGSLVAAGATARQRDEQLRGYVDATSASYLPYWMPRLGVNAELTQYGADELAQQLDSMQAAQITWVRQFFRWDEIEPRAGHYDWSAVDQIVNAFAERSDLRLVAVLSGSPDWAHPSSPEATDAPPDDPAVFATFANAFAARYSETIDHYQIWDEPNLAAAWGGLQPQPADYTALLSAAYDAIHGADEDAMVIAAALAPTTERGPQNVSELLYLRDLYALGLKDFSDAIAAKPYGFDASPEDRTVSEDVLNFSRLILLREEMVRNGDATTPLWASNWGWNSLPANWQGEPSIWGAVTGEEQVRFTLAALNRADREWPWLGGLILHQWQPDTPPESAQWGFALVDAQDQLTSLYEALAARAPQNNASNGLHFATNRFARYSGVWTFGDLGADIGWIQDSQLEFDFSGSDLSLLLRQDDYAAFLYTTVDGKPANATPRDATGNAIINLTSDLREPALELVPVARNLCNGQHTLHLIADRGWDRWAIAGFAVSSGDLAAPYNNQIAVALLTAVVAGLASTIAVLQIDWKPIVRHVDSIWARLGDAGQLVISAVSSIALLIGMLLTWGDVVPALFRREPVQLGLAVVTAGLLYVEPGLIIALAASAVLFAIFYHRIEYGLLLVVFYAPFFLFPVDLWRFSFPMSELLMLITAGAWALRNLADWGRARQSANTAFPPQPLSERLHRLHALDWGIAAWIVLGIISLSWTAYRDQAVTELRTLIVEPALFYIVLRSQRLDRRLLLRLVDALVLAGIVVCLVGLLQFLRGDAVITAEDGARRLASVYGSPNNVGLLLGRCVPFALAFALVPLDRRRRVGAALALVLMLGTLALTQSAGAIFLGVPVGIAVILLLLYGRRGLLALFGLGVVAGGTFVILANVSARFSRVLDLSAGTTFFRLRLWQSTLQMLQDHPITGLGLDQFLYYYRGQYILPDAWQEPNLSHPHNIVLDWWVRLGFAGLLVLVWLQVAFWRTALLIYRLYRPQDRYVAAIIAGCMGSMAALIAHGLIDNSVYVLDLSYILVLILGITANLATGTLPQSKQDKLPIVMKAEA